MQVFRGQFFGMYKLKQPIRKNRTLLCDLQYTNNRGWFDT